VVSRIADHVAVLQHGIVVGVGNIDELLAHPHDPYLKGLARARRLDEQGRTAHVRHA
jgi:ABC-type glutathione transport system ATPase component